MKQSLHRLILIASYAMNPLPVLRLGVEDATFDGGTSRCTDDCWMVKPRAEQPAHRFSGRHSLRLAERVMV